MDAIFFLEAETRALLFRTIAQNIGCAYICLWSYVPNFSDRLFCIDGWYNVEINQLSSPYRSLNQRLFNDYTQTQHSIENSFVPGLALKEGIPCLELNELELLQLSANEYQRKFYQESRLKSAVFLSCRSGEIEIGMFTSSIPANMKLELTSLFQQSRFKELTPLPTDQDWPSSSSSSLRSLSVGSPENPPVSLSMPRSTSYIPDLLNQTHTEQAIRPTSTTVLPYVEAYSRLCIQHLDPVSDNAALTRAMVAVISSSSSSSSYNNQALQTRNYDPQVTPNTGAFKEYTSAPLASNIQIEADSSRQQNMLKRSFSIMRNMEPNWREEQLAQETTNNSQLHHKMSERKRREKLNESFNELRSLLPPGSKKDKASVLSNTVEYLSNLKIEVSELNQKNQLMEARALDVRGKSEEAVGSSSAGKIDVDITKLSESTSDEQEMDLQVTVRGDCNIIDLVIDVLEYLKMVSGASLVSLNADIETTQTIPINRVIFTLKTKRSDLDKEAFQEDVRRIVSNVATN